MLKFFEFGILLEIRWIRQLEIFEYRFLYSQTKILLYRKNSERQRICPQNRIFCFSGDFFTGGNGRIFRFLASFPPAFLPGIFRPAIDSLCLGRIFSFCLCSFYIQFGHRRFFYFFQIIWFPVPAFFAIIPRPDF